MIQLLHTHTTFKIPTIRQEWLLIEQGDYAFSLDLEYAYLHIPIVKYHHL